MGDRNLTDGQVMGYEAEGMTLRDYFAATLQPHFDAPGFRQATALMGELPPDWGADPMHCVRWWAAAEARLRYIYADAMLRARRQA